MRISDLRACVCPTLLCMYYEGVAGVAGQPGEPGEPGRCRVMVGEVGSSGTISKHTWILSYMIAGWDRGEYGLVP